MKHIAIVMPVLNQFQLALEAIHSIQSQNKITVYPILNYREGLPLSGAWNLGIETATKYESPDYILVVNDDILFSHWTIDGLVRFFDKAPEDILMVTGWNVRGQLETIDEIYNWPMPENVRTPLDSPWGENPDFACFMIKPQTIKIVGKFDENFSPAYFEDNDYHHRINISGHKAVFTTTAPYYHYGSRTQNSDPDFPIVPPPAFEINKLYYMHKWGGEPGKECNPTPFNDPEKTFKDW